jgi:hypothetical protein
MVLVRPLLNVAALGSATGTRNWSKAMTAAQATILGWLHLIRAEFLELPGLHLTKVQIQRFWGLDVNNLRGAACGNARRQISQAHAHRRVRAIRRRSTSGLVPSLSTRQTVVHAERELRCRELGSASTYRFSVSTGQVACRIT